MASRALEVNLADYHVDVTIEKKYALLQETMADYYGLLKRLNIFLKELSHPYKNWNFIVKEARSFSLGYFHLLRSHPEGPEAVRIFADIFLSAVDQADAPEIKEDAAENLLLFLQHVLTDATTEIPLFLPVCQGVLQEILEHGNAGFHFFVTSYFQPNKLATLFMKVGAGEHQDHETINRFLIRFYDQSFSYWLGLEDPLSWIEKEASLSDDDHLAANLIKETSHPRIAI